MMLRLILQLFFLLMACGPLYAANGQAQPSQQPAYTPQQQSFVNQYYQALQGGADSIKQFENQVNDAANGPNATDDQIAQAQMLNNLTSGKTVSGAPGLGNSDSTQAQMDLTTAYWAARNQGPDALNQFIQQQQSQISTDIDLTAQQAVQQAAQLNKMIDNLNKGLGPDGGPPIGFHGDPTDPGPSNWSGWDIQFDANGNVIGFKKKDNPPPPGAGMGPPVPPPGVGQNGKLQSGFSLMCWRCYKNPPPPSVYRVQEIRCHGSDEGACTDNACPVGQQCEQYAEKSDVTGEDYFCHNCEEGPKDNCENHGLSSDGSCSGKCTEEGDMCVPVDFDLSTNSIMTSGSTREAGRPVLSCFMCKNHPPNINNLMCTQDGYFTDPTCNGQCSAQDCVQENIDTTTHQAVAEGQTTTNPTATCYACNTHGTMLNAMCSKDGYSGNASCDGKCPANDCEAVAINNQTGEEVSGTTFDANLVHTCYQCNSHASWMNAICSKDGYSGTSTCDGKCSADDCEAVAVDDSGKVVKGTTFDKNRVYTCYSCKSHNTTNTTTTTTTTTTTSYVVLIIEQPTERFVLNNLPIDPTQFIPSAVMALAKVDPSSGMITNVLGQLKQITDFTSAFGVGFGPGGLTTTGTISMDQLTGMLQSSLSSGGDYGSNCFNNVQNQADKNASSAGTPTSQDITQGKDSPQGNSSDDLSTPTNQIQTSDNAAAPAVSGPVVACGTQNNNKVLQIFDAGGQLVSTITQNMLKGNPGIILQQLGAAQGLTDQLMSKSGIDFASLAGQFTGLPIKQMLQAASDDNTSVVPNDPLYPKPAKKKKHSSGFSLLSLIAPVGPIDTSTELNVKDQYYLNTIGYTPLSDPNSAWNVMDVTQKNVLVAVVDSGLDLSHPDGPQYIWTNPQDGSHGWNFVNENNTDFTDYRGHGTAVAGIIAAKWNNGIGMAGINPGAVIMPVKIADDKGETNSLAVYRGINFAVDHGARIINLSIGGPIISRLEQQAIERANAMGVLVVVAAGNTNDNLMSFGPSSSKYALAVGMTDFDGTRSVVSSWGPNLQILAPGEQIWSLCSKDTKEVLPSVRKYGYYKQSGTSFSAPMVTATASLILAKNPQLTPEQVADIIRQTATPLGKTDWDDKTGFGLLNASAALRASVSDQLLVMITNMHYNRDNRGHLTSLDIYGTVRGAYKEFSIEGGRGKTPMGYRTIAGPFHGQYNYQFITRLVIRDVLRGSDEWVLRLKVIDQDGKEHIASTYFNFPGK